MGWTLIKEEKSKFFQFKWRNHRALYTVKNNEDKILKKMRPFFLKQIHSNIIVDTDCSKRTTGDGLITRRKDHALGIRVADCLPVYLFSARKVCIIHCGWRGIIKDIVKAAAKLVGSYRYVLGASIDQCCYEVRKDVAELFEHKYRHAIIAKDSHYYLDLKAAVIEDLGRKHLIGSLALCTHCHPELFYSYRRGDSKKRNYALITTH